MLSRMEIKFKNYDKKRMNTKLQERKKLNLVYANRIGKMKAMYKGKSIDCRTEKLALCFLSYIHIFIKGCIFYTALYNSFLL